MAFCQKCGLKLDDSAKFCPECGNPVGQKNMSKRQQEFGGKIIKCPNCGETLNSFTSVCSACGYELRGADAAGTVKRFESELKQIEAGRKTEKGTGIGKAFAKAFGANTTNTVDQQLASRISNFTVPNTQEDIFEFMILAASNIDPMAYDTSSDGYALAEREGKLMLSNAWDSKYNQVHQKAKMMFPNDPRLLEIEELYKAKKKEIRSNKAKYTKLLLGFVIVFFASIGILIGSENRKEAELEKELKAIVVEIREDIKNGDYDDALIKANGLRFDESLDSKKAEDWEEQREYLIDLINEKKEEN